MRETRRLELLKISSLDAIKQTKRKPKKASGSGVVAVGSYGEKMLQSGIEIKKEVYISLVLLSSAFAGYMLSGIGPIFAIFFAFAMAHYFLFPFLDEKATKRRRQVMPLLPSFIDGLASALGTGFNLETAIVQATQGVPEGIFRTELDRVVQGISNGLSIEEAFVSLKQRIAGKEITSVAVALSLFSGMGGRMLDPFKRLATKVREQQRVMEKATRDLVQIKQAFMILAFLSIAAPGALLIVEPNYLSSAFQDPFGRLMIQIALMIQVSALMCFKRITTLKL